MPFLPYGRQHIDDEDARAVEEALRSDYLTTGPRVAQFESAVAGIAGAQYGVAVSNGTAALHCAMHALDIGPGDEVIVPPMTFAATANCVLYQGGRPVFADVCEDTLLLDVTNVRKRITSRTRAIIVVDYAGQPADYADLGALAHDHGLTLVADACHSLGGSYRGRPVGSLADMTVFSFHPVKPITSGEGGMIVTDEASLAERMRRFRNHGIDTDFRQRESSGSWEYAVVELGYNYRLTDIQCALGLSQLRKLDSFRQKREVLARYYLDLLLVRAPAVRPLFLHDDRVHGWHLFMVRIDYSGLGTDRATVFKALRARGIGVNVHYAPVHLHPLYRERLGTSEGTCPVAEAAYKELLTLPLHVGMEMRDVERVVDTLGDITCNCRRE